MTECLPCYRENMDLSLCYWEFCYTATRPRQIILIVHFPFIIRFSLYYKLQMTIDSCFLCAIFLFYMIIMFILYCNFHCACWVFVDYFCWNTDLIFMFAAIDLVPWIVTFIFCLVLGVEVINLYRYLKIWGRVKVIYVIWCRESTKKVSLSKMR